MAGNILDTTSKYQVQLAYKSSGATVADSSGDNAGKIVFDSASSKIWVNGVDWYLYNDNLQNTLTAKAKNASDTLVTLYKAFDQKTDVSIGFVNGDETTLTQTIKTNAIEYTHNDSSAGLAHIPSGGASGQFLVWNQGNGTDSVTNNARWTTADDDFGGTTQGIYIKQGEITATNVKTIAKDVSNGALFTDTLYEIKTRSLSDSSARIELIKSGTDTSTSVVFRHDSNQLKWYDNDSHDQLTLDVADGRKMPLKDTDASYAKAFYDWKIATTVEDEDAALNNWKNITDFLDGINDSSTLAKKLLDKSESSHIDDHAVVTNNAAGVLPKIPTTGISAVASDVNNQSTYLYYTSNGTDSSWQKLPSSAYSKAYDASLTLNGMNYQPNQGNSTHTNISLVSLEDSTFSVVTDTTNKIITVSGPSVVSIEDPSAQFYHSKCYDASSMKHTLFWTVLP